MTMMTMLMPRSHRDFFDNFLADPFDTFFSGAPVQRETPQMMRTDIKEHDDRYELVIDLPGFNKDDITAELKDGVLTISAHTNQESEDKDEKGTYVRKERFTGQCSRSFYVGDDVEESDVHAKFDNGTLKIEIPKKTEQKKLEEKKTIAIEG